MKFDIDISCPGCGHEFKQSLSNMKHGNSCICPKCNQTIQFTGDDLNQVEKDINKSIDNIKKSFKGFGN